VLDSISRGNALELSDDEYQRLRSSLARALRRACPSWLDSRRDDLVQTAVLRVLDARPRREERDALSPSYMYRVAYAVVVDEMRRAQWRRETPIEQEDGPVLQAPARDAGPERVLQAREISSGIRECLSRLPLPRRLAVTLHLQGYSFAEASQTLDWSAKRTENLTYRGLTDLRACLAAKGLGP
jgi:RNA polymerase sigma-70 factor (ECF subfamily)